MNAAHPIRGPVCASTDRRGGTIPAPLSDVSTSLEAQCVPRRVDMGTIPASTSARLHIVSRLIVSDLLPTPADGARSSPVPRFLQLTISADEAMPRLDYAISKSSTESPLESFPKLIPAAPSPFALCPRPRPCHQTFRHSDFDSSSGRAQETASPESGHTPRTAEGRSICIKAEKIVGDSGPKGMRDSKPAGEPSTLGGVSTTAGAMESGVVDPRRLLGLQVQRRRSFVPCGDWGTSTGSMDVLPRGTCAFLRLRFWFMGFAACLQAKCSSAASTQSLWMLPRLANRVAVPFFSPPAWLNIPTERDLEIAEAEEQMAESLIHTEATAQDTL
ncbi:hypothetical protein B0H11DRAFT_1915895 [Mycena galericulata]|nr:hypothetical protein B0H11DRAFT_1915895 [Mycena galericulata]